MNNVICSAQRGRGDVDNKLKSYIVSLLGGVLLAAAVAGVAGCAVVAGAGGGGSVICCTFLPVRPADAAVSCLRRGLPEAVYTRQVAPHSSSPPAPWAPALSFLKRVQIVPWMLSC